MTSPEPPRCRCGRTFADIEAHGGTCVAGFPHSVPPDGTRAQVLHLLKHTEDVVDGEIMRLFDEQAERVHQLEREVNRLDTLSAEYSTLLVQLEKALRKIARPGTPCTSEDQWTAIEALARLDGAA